MFKFCMFNFCSCAIKNYVPQFWGGEVPLIYTCASENVKFCSWDYMFCSYWILALKSAILCFFLIISFHFIFYPHQKTCLLILEIWERRERVKERNINRLPLVGAPNLHTEPATQAHDLTGKSNTCPFTLGNNALTNWATWVRAAIIITIIIIIICIFCTLYFLHLMCQ